MFEAKVYTVCILSPGIVLEEEHIAHEVIIRWNIEEGEKHGVTFLTVPNILNGKTPDIYIFAIDNYIDELKIKAAIATGAKVMLFFRSHHDEKNTLESEVKAIDDFRSKVQDECACVDYSDKRNFDDALKTVLSNINNM